MSAYLADNRFERGRNYVTYLRAGNPELRVETGRYEGARRADRRPTIPREERTCLFCFGAVEDEKHFMLDCPLYGEARAELQATFLNVTRGKRPVNLASPSMSADAKLSFLIGDGVEGFVKKVRVQLNSAVKRFVMSAFAERRRWFSSGEDGQLAVAFLVASAAA